MIVTFATSVYLYRMNLLPIRPEDTVFLGDSLTEGFNFKVFFGRDDLRNRGISGNLTDHVIYRMEEITYARPARLFLMIGINDLFSGRSIDSIFKNILRILDFIGKKSPQTQILVQSLLPVNTSRNFEDKGINLEIYKLNNLLEHHCTLNPGLTFIDLHSAFLDNSGEMDSIYTFDGVHLSDEGYQHWASLLKKLV